MKKIKLYYNPKTKAFSNRELPGYQQLGDKYPITAVQEYCALNSYSFIYFNEESSETLDNRAIGHRAPNSLRNLYHCRAGQNH